MCHSFLYSFVVSLIKLYYYDLPFTMESCMKEYLVIFLYIINLKIYLSLADAF